MPLDHAPNSSLAVEVVEPSFWDAPATKQDQQVLAGDVLVVAPEWEKLPLFDIHDSDLEVTKRERLRKAIRKFDHESDPNEIIAFLSNFQGGSSSKLQAIALSLAGAYEMALHIREQRLATQVAVFNITQLVVRDRHPQKDHAPLRPSRPLTSALRDAITQMTKVGGKLVMPGYLHALSHGHGSKHTGESDTARTTAVVVSMLLNDKHPELLCAGEKMPENVIQSEREKLAKVVQLKAA